ncbi:MAG: type I 3-dehydroquinate dehydratase [Deltaproteobacteria bacterium]
MAKKDILSGERPNIAAVVADVIDPKGIKQAIKSGAGLLELRIDTFKDRDIERLKKEVSGLKRIKTLRKIPFILTVRDKKEGGRFYIKDADREAIFSSLMPYADFIDIELKSSAILGETIRLAKKNGKKVILSCHDFKATPGGKTLESTIRRSLVAGADIVKIACLAKNRQDLKRLAGLLLRHKGLIVIAMGRYGACSRILFPAIGSVLTYGSISRKTAPGQMPAGDIHKLLKCIGLRPAAF